MAGYRQPLSTVEAVGLAAAGLLLASVLALLALLPLTAPSGSLGQLAGEAYLRRVLGFTLLQAALSAFLAVAGAAIVARALARQRHFPGRDLILWFCALPMVMPTIVAIFGLVAVYGRSGWLADAAAALGSDWRPSIYGLPGILIAHVFFNLPLAIRLLLPAWGAPPAETWRLAAQFGMTSRQIFRLIEWPLLRQYLPAAFALVFMLCALSFAVVLALGGGPRATTLEVAIYQALRFDYDLGRGGILALVQLAICLGLAALCWRLGRHLDFGAGLRAAVARPDAAVGRWIDGSAIAAAAVFVILPLAALLIDGAWAVIRGHTDWVSMARAALVTLALGLPSGIIATALAFALASGTDRLRRDPIYRPFAALAGLAGLVGVAVSPMALGTGIQLTVMSAVDLYAAAPYGVVGLNAVLSLPFAIGLLTPAIARANARNDRLCASLALRGWARLHRIDWPVLRRPVATALALTTVMSMGDLAAIALFGNQSLTNLTLLLYNQLAAYRLDQAAVTSVVLLALCLGVFAVLERSVGGRGAA